MRSPYDKIRWSLREDFISRLYLFVVLIVCNYLSDKYFYIEYIFIYCLFIVFLIKCFEILRFCICFIRVFAFAIPILAANNEIILVSTKKNMT